MKLIWIFITIGGFAGSYIPVIFGVDPFSAWSIIGGVLGSIVGIYLYKKLEIEE